MTSRDPIVVIGAGPAGIAAASTLVAGGERPVLIDEAVFPGGQIFRAAPSPLRRSDRELYGFDANRARLMRQKFTSLLPSITYLHGTTVWGVEPSVLHLARGGHVLRQPWKQLIVAAGAMDRIVPINGWTASGVYTLGAAQIALKASAATLGHRIVLIGSGPLLYLVAYQYARAGAQVVAVLESAGPASHVASLPGLMSGGRIFAKGLYYVAWLLAHGITIETGVEPLEVLRTPEGQVAGIRYKTSAREKTAFCDTLAIGYGLKAETQIADLLGADFRFDQQARQWLPVADLDGRSTVEGVYLAGDGLSIRGSEVAECSGELAAHALLVDSGRAEPASMNRLRRKIQGFSRFRRSLDAIFAFPDKLVATVTDDTMICRCEGLTAGAVRSAAAYGEADINRIKAFTRLGMGRCQGRICGAAAAELIAAERSIHISEVGRLRGQAPIKPIALSSMAGGVHDNL